MLKRVRDKEVEEFEISMERFFDKVISRAEFNQYVKDAAKELEDFLNRESSLSNESKLMFLSKFIFSALIDADRANSRMFDSNLTFETTPDSRKLFENYYKKLQLKLHELQNKSHLT